ncbi:MAG: hypothetical protein V1906_00070 [Candidatus Woesearchaeota archaeon]
MKKIKEAVKNRKMMIIAVIAILACMIAIPLYYFPKGVLEVSVTDIYGEALPGAEVWIWDKDNFKGSPELIAKTDSNGIAKIELFRGQYAVSLASEIKNEIGLPPVKYSVFLEIKKGEKFSLPLIRQE